VTRREADLQNELKTMGVANLISAAAGGYVSCISLSRTTLNYAAGGRGRISGFVVAAICLALLVTGSGFLSYVPKFVLGGLLLYLGAQLLYTWAIAPATRLSRLEYASLLAIALIILQWGFIAGVLIGVIIGCATFAVSASRVNTIKFSFDGREYRSSLDRGPDELAILDRHGRQIQGLALQSYLFFGSANLLYQHVQSILAETSPCRFLLFDFRLVTGLDSSALHSFTQIKQVADKKYARLVFVSLPQHLHTAFERVGVLPANAILAEDLDHALELCEQKLIATYADEQIDTPSLEAWLSHALADKDLAERLAASCDRIEVAKGEIIAAQGDPSNVMHFIFEGRIGVFVPLDDERMVRVRSLGPRTTIGEMGLITGKVRSATIRAEAPSVLYALSANAYERIKRDDPILSQALLAYVLTVMAERLGFASLAIGVLRR
jgi:sulfate permease, SulP family